MAVFTEQLLIKISPDLKDLIEQASQKALQENKKLAAANNILTQSDWLRDRIRLACEQELQKYTMNSNYYVKNEILNKVIWTIISCWHINKLPNQPPFNFLCIDDFSIFSRDYVENSFFELKNKSCLDCEKNHRGVLNIFNFNYEKLLEVARENIRLETAKPTIISFVEKWNSKEGISLEDALFHSMALTGIINTKITLDNWINNGFIILGLFQGPSQYASYLWSKDILDTKVNSNSSTKGLYVTYPDIYIGTRFV